jgi:hypothetical protein
MFSMLARDGCVHGRNIGPARNAVEELAVTFPLRRVFSAAYSQPAACRRQGNVRAPRPAGVTAKRNFYLPIFSTTWKTPALES